MSQLSSLTVNAEGLNKAGTGESEGRPDSLFQPNEKTEDTECWPNRKEATLPPPVCHAEDVLEEGVGT